MFGIKLFLQVFNQPRQTIRVMISSSKQNRLSAFIGLSIYLIFLIDTIYILSQNGKISIVKTAFTLIVSLLIPLWLLIHRFVWNRMNRFGLVLVSGIRLPKNERVIHSAQLNRLYPYLMSIGTIPLAFILFLRPVNQAGTSSQMFLALVYDVVFILAVIAMQAYSFAVGVLAMQEIYKVSPAQAIFGPFLARLILFVILLVLLLAILIPIKLVKGHL